MKLKNLIRFLSHRNLGSPAIPRDACVRIIHAGGREERYRSPIPAFQLMNKYPGMWVARPQVFRKPHDSILWPSDNLIPGQKYYMIPSTTAQKLKRKFRNNPEHPDEKNRIEIPEKSSALARLPGPDSGIRCFLRKKGMGKNKPFVPPISTERACRSIGWEPSLTSVQEISP